MVRLCAALILMFAIAGCGGKGVLVYPQAAIDPADVWPAEGPDCRDSSPMPCRDLVAGTGGPVRAFAQVTVRVTVEDTKPPETRGPVMVTFVYPAFEKVNFRDREWDVTFTIMAPGADVEPWFAREEAALLGHHVLGMRVGGTRRVTDSGFGKVGSIKLPPGQPRHYTLELTQACYPRVHVSSNFHFSMLDSTHSPFRFYPLLTFSGCGRR